MKSVVSSRSDVGRVREINEDRVLVEPGLGLYAVCDGMGGRKAGEVASRIACQVLKLEVENAFPERERYQATGSPEDIEELRAVLEHAVVAASQEVYRQSALRDGLSGMGATCTAILLPGGHKGIFAHVGDSRLYVIRAGSIHQLSEDHTYRTRRAKGCPAPSQADAPDNLLSRALGVQPSVQVDTAIFDVDPGDTFILCSDGVHHYFPDPLEMVAQVNVARLDEGIDRLVDLALERGGHDNASAVAVRVTAIHADQDRMAAEQRINILRRIPLFSRLSYNELVRVLAYTHQRSILADEVIIHEQAEGAELYVLLAGEVLVTRKGETIGILGVGMHFGEMALFDNAPRSATITALRAGRLLVMRRQEFFHIIRSEPVLASKLLWSCVNVLSGRLRRANEFLDWSRAGEAESTPEFKVFDDAAP